MTLSEKLFLTAAALMVPVLQGGVIVDATVSGSPGAFSYAYDIQNQNSVGLLLFSVTVSGDVGTIQAPSGWITSTGIPSRGQTLVEWISTDAPFDAQPSGTLSGFSFISALGAGSVDFATFDENFSELDGQTTGPVASTTPEPNSLTLLGAAIMGMCIILRGRRTNMTQSGALTKSPPETRPCFDGLAGREVPHPAVGITALNIRGS